MSHIEPSSAQAQNIARARALVSLGIEPSIRELPQSTRTAVEAADALGCEVGAIASSLVFIADDEPLLVMTSGRHRVSESLLAARGGKAVIRRASAAEVRQATSQAIGGVAPIGHPAQLETIVDSALRDYPMLWAAAGTPNSIFDTTFDELVRMTAGRESAVD